MTQPQNGLMNALSGVMGGTGPAFGTQTSAITAPPVWPGPTPTIAEPVLGQIQRLRNLLTVGGLASGGYMNENLAQSMYGIPYAQLGPEQRATIAGAMQEISTQAAHMTDDQLARLAVSNPAIRSAVNAYDPGINNSLNHYVSTNPSAMLPTIDRQRLDADIWEANNRLRIAEQQGNEGLALQERQRLDALEEQRASIGLQQGALTGTFNGQETLAARQQRFNEEMARAQLGANPRNFVQYLLAGGNPSGGGNMVPLDPDAVHAMQGPVSSSAGDVTSYLQNSPMVQAKRQEAGYAPQAGNDTVHTMGGPSVPTAPNQPGFQFVKGRHYNVRQWNDMKPTEQAFAESLASFAGEDPADWRHDRERAAPKGRQAGLTSYA